MTILIRGASLDASMSRYLIDELERKPNVEVRTGGEIAAFAGDERLERVTIRNRATARWTRSTADARVHLHRRRRRTPAGCPSSSCATSAATSAPAATYRPDARRRGRSSAIRYLLETSVPGIFAAGDVRHGSVKRVAAGVGEGSIAIAFVHEHLAELAAAKGTPAG